MHAHATRPGSTSPARSPAWIDAHLDLAYLAELGRDLEARIGLGQRDCCSLPDLAEAPVELCLGTIFIEPGLDNSTHPWGYRDRDDRRAAGDAGRRQIARYEQLERSGLVRIVRWREDLDDPSDGRLRVVILVEGADCIDGGDELSWWFERGVRALGLAWAMGTRAAGGNKVHGGLSAEGRDLVAAADRLGILHDVSHLADAAFDELLTLSDRRVVATHSNARWLLDDGDNERHLTPAQVRSIAARDGAIGLNLYGNFLASGRDAVLEDCIRHVEAIAEIAGHDRVGLGSDLDGGFGTDRLPRGLEHPSKYGSLDHALARQGWSDAARAGFRRDNWLRVLRETLPSRTPPPR